MKYFPVINSSSLSGIKNTIIGKKSINQDTIEDIHKEQANHDTQNNHSMEDDSNINDSNIHVNDIDKDHCIIKKKLSRKINSKSSINQQDVNIMNEIKKNQNSVKILLSFVLFSYLSYYIKYVFLFNMTILKYIIINYTSIWFQEILQSIHDFSDYLSYNTIIRMTIGAEYFLVYFYIHRILGFLVSMIIRKVLGIISILYTIL